MKTSPEGVAFIAAHEGVVTHAYRDVAGIWTIGVGHTASAGPPAPVRGMTISRAEAMRLLAVDLPKYERRVARALPDVRQHVFDGAVSFDFNTGAIDRASWVAAYRAGRLAEARTRLMQWTKAGGRSIAGLVRRRTAEAALIFDAKGAAAHPPAAGSGAYADKLDALGFRGADAVIAYQRAHPDLVADGILGPATRAQIDRDTTARAALRNLGAGAALGAGSAAAGGIPWWIVLAGAAVILVAAAAFGWRYRDELLRMFKPKGTTA